MTKTVASLCPWPAYINRPLFTRVKDFYLPAASKGQPPVTRKIEDDIQFEKILSISPQVSHTILGEAIAADFVLHTSRQGPFMDEDARPAIWICEGPSWTEEEVQRELPKLKAYCGLVVEYADDLDRRRESGEPHVPKVTQRMKDCARFLDLKRGWLTELVNASTTCVFCTKTIPMHAIKCPECNEVVNREKYDLLRKSGGKLPEPSPVG
jgi:hypothetical protein